MPYRRVTILSDDIVEVKTYQRLNTHGGGDFSDIEKGAGENHEKNYSDRQKMRKTNVRQLVTCNFDVHSKFITLTFRDNVTDVKQANKAFKKFVMRLTYWNDRKPFKYLAVVEFQKRGAVHYHMIADMDFVPSDMLAGLWGQGFVKINDIRQVDNVGAYVVKYMSKDQDDPRLQGLKAYNCSRGLKRPTELKSWLLQDYAAVKEISSKLQKEPPVYRHEYTSGNTGKILYQQYNFKRSSSKRQEKSD